MKLTIHRNTLLEHLSRVAKAAGKDFSTSGMLVVASGGTLTLTATDSELTISAKLDGAQIHHEGKTVLPAKAFLGAIQKLPASDVNIELTGTQALVQCGKTKIKLSATDPDEFPATKSEGDPICTIDADELREMITDTMFAVATNDKTPVLCGINLKFGDALTATACDRHRLSQHTLGHTGESLLELNLPTKAATELAALKGSGVVEIAASQSQITFAYGNYRIMSGVLGGTYPDTSRMFGNPAKSEATVNAADFAAAVERAKVTTDTGSSIIRLQVADNEVTITSKDDAGNATLDSVDAELIGDPIALSCNGQFLLDVLKRCGDKARLSFTGTMSPIIITDPDNSHSRFLVLPYRTTEG